MILAYHRVNPWYRNDALTVSPQRFRAQIVFLLRKGWQPAPLSTRRQPRTFSVTFDDGLFDIAVYAVPVLEELGVPATVFLPAELIGTGNLLPRYRDPHRDRFLTWDEVRQISRRGISFGAHGMRHERLPALLDEDARRAVAVSRRRIQPETGQAVPFFCYPYGDFTDAIIEHVRAAGYEGAVVTPTRPVREGRYTLLRIGIYNHTSWLAYRVKIWNDCRRSGGCSSCSERPSSCA